MRSSMPVVLMTGYRDTEPTMTDESGTVNVLGGAAETALAIGADEVLQKPLSARDLAKSLARVLRL